MRTRCVIPLVAAVGLLVASVLSVHADDRDNMLDQKEELARIQQEIQDGHRILDSLKDEELSVQKEVSEYDQRISSNQKIISRLGSQLKNIKGDISSTEQQLSEAQNLFERTRRRYLGNLRQFYMASREPVETYTNEPNEEIRLKRQAVYLRAIAGLESDNIEQTADLLAATEDHLEGLSGESKKVASLRKQKETATSLDSRRKEHREKELAALHRLKAAEADRISMLAQAAEEMESIIARLEQESRRGTDGIVPAPVTPSILESIKGQLGVPCRGKITTTFGYSTDPVTRLKSFSPGIVVSGKAGRNVTAVASGRVVYVGELRGYGNFVIVDHGDQYYSTYAGLTGLAVAKGRMVQAGTTLATAGDGNVRFELRRGREALDPVKWIKIDSF